MPSPAVRIGHAARYADLDQVFQRISPALLSLASNDLAALDLGQLAFAFLDHA